MISTDAPRQHVTLPGDGWDHISHNNFPFKINYFIFKKLDKLLHILTDGYKHGQLKMVKVFMILVSLAVIQRRQAQMWIHHVLLVEHFCETFALLANIANNATCAFSLKKSNDFYHPKRTNNYTKWVWYVALLRDWAVTGIKYVFLYLIENVYYSSCPGINHLTIRNGKTQPMCRKLEIVTQMLQ